MSNEQEIDFADSQEMRDAAQQEQAMTEESNSLNIYQRINEVRKKIQYIKKDASVQGYRAVTHDAVTSMVRNELIQHCIIIVPEILESTIEDVGKTQKGAVIIRYAAKMMIHFVNGDNPDDRVSVLTEAHANDHGDKATGKALSYGTKNAILKVFTIETGENDESRTEPYQASIEDVPAHKVQAKGGKYDGMELGQIATSAGRAGLGYILWLSRNAKDDTVKSKAGEVWDAHRPDLTADQIDDELADVESIDELTGLFRCLTSDQEAEFKDKFTVRRGELEADKPQRTAENARS